MRRHRISFVRRALPIYSYETNRRNNLSLLRTFYLLHVCRLGKTILNYFDLLFWFGDYYGYILARNLSLLLNKKMRAPHDSVLFVAFSLIPTTRLRERNNFANSGNQQAAVRFYPEFGEGGTVLLARLRRRLVRKDKVRVHVLPLP